MLNNVGIHTIRDFILDFPIEFIKETTQLPKEGGTVAINVICSKKISAGRIFFIMVLFNQQPIKVIFFNKKIWNIFRPGQNYKLFGNLRMEKNEYILEHPKILSYTKSLFPIYRGKMANELRNKITNEIIKNLPWEETIYENVSLKEALSNLHNGLNIEIARKSLAFLEASAFVKTFSKEERQENFEGDMQKSLSFLPFKPNNEQAQVIKEIEEDLKSNRPLKRLIYGEVGSGKTLIATAISIFMASKYRVAFLAPTAALAMQHANWIMPILEKAQLKGVLLTGATKQKKKIKEIINSGGFDIIIGTHALLHEIEIPNLGLLIIDEMQRFGIIQRAKLLGAAPLKNLLMLSATPIPRSLNLMLSSFLDFSIIKKSVYEKKIATFIMQSSKMEELIDRLKNKDEKIYWVLPAIEESVNCDGVEKRFSEMQEILTDVAMLHGRMKEKEKIEVLNDFRDGKIKWLISTTVIEIGIDIPDANIMVIEQANRFGLAQLHQLRGRIGRKGQNATCILLYDFPISRQSWKKLMALKENADGFAIAEKDLELRGSGEWIGSQQHGLRHFRFLNLPQDLEILDLAKKKKTTHKSENLFIEEAEYNH